MTDRRQRQKDLRAQRRVEEQKAATRRELRRRIVIAIGVGVALVTVLLLTSLEPGNDTSLPVGYELFRSQPTACGAEPPPAWIARTFDAPAQQDPLPTVATIETSCGPITLALNPDAPGVVNSFAFLARQGFYDGLVFHRIDPDFRIFAGDPEANGTGGAGYRLDDELPPEGFVYEPGVVAMAESGGGPSSQFFIVTGPDASVLTRSFSVLGQVSDGQETIDLITRLPIAAGNPPNRPAETVYIESISFDD